VKDLPHVKIRAEGRLERLDLIELWQRRDLAIELVLSDFRMRHRQTIIGIVWAFLQPFATVAVFSVLFGYFAKFPSNGVPYPLFLFSGYLIWSFFSRGVLASVQGLTSNVPLVSKVYVPRAFLIMAPIATAAFELLISLVMLSVFYLYFTTLPPKTIVFYPFVLLFAVFVILAVSFWLAPLNALLRDIQLTLPSALQLMFFITPIVYPISLLPEWLQLLSYVNPMTAVIEASRWCLTDAPPPSVIGFGISVVVVLMTLLPGTVFFATRVRVVADRI